MSVKGRTIGLTCIPKSDARVEKHERISLPMIDLGGLNQKMSTRSLVVEDIGNACSRLGCFKVINHGISKSVINGALEAAAGFFALSEEEKKEYASEDVHQPVRYGVCTKDDRIIKPRDFLKQYANPLDEWIKFWPHSPPDYREKMGKFATEVKRVALQLMDAIFESLGLGKAYTREKLEEGMQVMTVNNYEKSSQLKDLMLGLAAHSDYGYITILLQSCDGLEIVDKNTNTWKAVPAESEALHVHIGDYLEVLSNGQYKSVVHRVILNCKKRMSIASIHGLSIDDMVIPASQLVDEQHPKGYKDSSFRDFLSFISMNDFTKGCNFIDSLRTDNS
ncbi:uncharacterized protein A4U43_C04F32500 [Asparagus officinalis]|uniref:Fe2OG dioxygenase domain-containing protein n=1 Tax=Asparagus officinalis TaxID=4686 RepID=A0A5P1FA51_ASPOF|nr:protein DOWNY MILDEW RESISTANCE 6-like [Asparagus officinalis]ONK73521.1 uncharacterized protein A4U43_C04F32500 [Asparagus officinalis]